MYLLMLLQPFDCIRVRLRNPSTEILETSSGCLLDIKAVFDDVTWYGCQALSPCCSALDRNRASQTLNKLKTS